MCEWLTRRWGRVRSEDGQALVEFVLVLPVILTITFAAIEFGDAFWKYQQLSAATSEGARAGIVSAGGGQDAAVDAAVRAAAPNLDDADLTVSTVSSWLSGEDLTVRAAYPMEIAIFGLEVWDGDITSERTMRVE